MLYFSRGSRETELSPDDMKEGLRIALEKIGMRRKVLAVPPDITRAHSGAGPITQWIHEYYRDRLTDVLPALGTHNGMTDAETTAMYRGVPKNLFRVHNWRTDLVTLGTVPGSYVSDVSNGLVEYPWPAQVNRLIAEGGHDLILSIGQVVPHEVIGMANYTKNIFVGTGGREGINKSHFLGAAFGMERIMGRADTPVRAVLNYAAREYARNLPIVYVLTVLSRNGAGKLVFNGLFIGDDDECFYLASALSAEVNVTKLDKPLKKVVVYLDEAEYRSTWLGNKSIYRTRMAIDDGGELTVIAPGVKEFGEDRGIDRLIRTYGYTGTERVMSYLDHHDDLKESLSAAAHLIHGSSEGRFRITYCPGKLTKEEVENVGFSWAPIEPMLMRYNPLELKDGYNTLPDGEEIFFISNPAVGLWAWKDRFEKNG